MEQRRPRLGDIVDDYCPRERRITNHAIVAMVEDEVKHTRCTTCDADHDYKHARVPPQRKRKEASALDGPFTDEGQVRSASPAVADAEDAVDNEPIESGEPGDEAGAPASAGAAEDAELTLAAGDDDQPAGPDDDGPVHRRLIRATLPRPEGHLPERKEPDFTIRQPGRGGRFDHAGNGNPGNKRHRRGGRGSQHASGGQRFGQGGGGQRQGQGGGDRQNGNRADGFGNSRQSGRHGGGGHGRGGGRRRGR